MMTRLTCCCLMALVGFGGAALAQTPASAGGQFVVASGSGSLRRAPDRAWVSIAAESRATTPVEAQRLSAEAMTAVQKALAGAAVPEDAIRTTGYSLQPDMQYDDGRARVRGYIARNQIEVRVDDLARLGPVIDAAGASGATSMAGLRFGLQDRESVEQEALQLAVKDAIARARAMAAGAGVTLGSVLRIEQRGDLAGPPMPFATMRQAADTVETPIAPGELEIGADVTVTVAIE
jgi:hypothetical protein